MKRSEMLEIIHDTLKDINIPGYDERLPDRILTLIEEAGMAPPALSGAKCKALAHVYLYPDYNLWDEDFEKDKKALEVYNK